MRRIRALSREARDSYSKSGGSHYSDINSYEMANALPQAIGAQEVYPKRQVICLSGDGGFWMLMGDFLSLKQLKLSVKIIVFNNGGLNFVELEMKAAGILTHGTSLVETDFSKFADAAGILGLRAERPEQVKPMLNQALEHNGPALVDGCREPSGVIYTPNHQPRADKGLYSVYD